MPEEHAVRATIDIDTQQALASIERLNKALLNLDQKLRNISTRPFRQNNQQQDLDALYKKTGLLIKKYKELTDVQKLSVTQTALLRDRLNELGRNLTKLGKAGYSVRKLRDEIIKTRLNLKQASKGASSFARQTMTSIDKLKVSFKGLNKRIQEHESIMSGWWARFGLVAVGFTVAYRAINAAENALSSFFDTVKRGIDISGELTSIQASLATWGTIFGSNAQSWEEAFQLASANIRAFREEIPYAISSTQELSKALDELAQHGVIVGKESMKEFVAFADFINMISQNTQKSVNQIRQEIQSLFEGTARQGNTLLILLKKLGKSDTEIKKIVDELRKGGNATEQWTLLVKKFYPYIERMRLVMRTADVGKQFEKWRDSLALMVADATDLATSMEGLSQGSNIFADILAKHVDKIIKNKDATEVWAVVLQQVAHAFDRLLTVGENFFKEIPRWTIAAEGLFKDVFSNETVQNILKISVVILGLNTAFNILLKTIKALSSLTFIRMMVKNPALASGLLTLGAGYYLSENIDKEKHPLLSLSWLQGLGKSGTGGGGGWGVQEKPQEKDFWDTISDYATNAYQKLNNAVDQYVQKATAGINKVNKELKDSSKELKGNARGFKELDKEVIKAVKSFEDLEKQIYTITSNKLLNNLINIHSKFQKMREEAEKAFRVSGGQISGERLSKLKEFIDEQEQLAINQQIQNRELEISKELLSEHDRQIASIEDKYAEWVEKIIELAEVQGWSQEKLNEYLNKINAKMEHDIIEHNNKIKAQQNTLVESWRHTYERITDFLADAILDWKGGLESFFNWIKQSLAQMLARGVVGSLAGMLGLPGAQAWAGAGGVAGQGSSGGLFSNIGSAISAAGGLWNWISGGFKNIGFSLQTKVPVAMMNMGLENVGGWLFEHPALSGGLTAGLGSFLLQGLLGGDWAKAAVSGTATGLGSWGGAAIAPALGFSGPVGAIIGAIGGGLIGKVLGGLFGDGTERTYLERNISFKYGQPWGYETLRWDRGEPDNMDAILKAQSQLNDLFQQTLEGMIDAFTEYLPEFGEELKQRTYDFFEYWGVETQEDMDKWIKENINRFSERTLAPLAEEFTQHIKTDFIESIDLSIFTSEFQQKFQDIVDNLFADIDFANIKSQEDLQNALNKLGEALQGLGGLRQGVENVNEILDTLQEAVSGNLLSEYEQGLANINEQFDAYKQQLEALGVDLEKVTVLEEARAKNIKEYVRGYQDKIKGLEKELFPTHLSIEDINKKYGLNIGSQDELRTFLDALSNMSSQDFQLQMEYLDKLGVSFDEFLEDMKTLMQDFIDKAKESEEALQDATQAQIEAAQKQTEATQAQQAQADKIDDILHRFNDSVKTIIWEASGFFLQDTQVVLEKVSEGFQASSDDIKEVLKNKLTELNDIFKEQQKTYFVSSYEEIKAAAKMRQEAEQLATQAKNALSSKSRHVVFVGDRAIPTFSGDTYRASDELTNVLFGSDKYLLLQRNRAIADQIGLGVSLRDYYVFDEATQTYTLPSDWRTNWSPVGNSTVSSELSRIGNSIDALNESMQENNYYNRRTSDTLTKWDYDGQPETREPI